MKDWQRIAMKEAEAVELLAEQNRTLVARLSQYTDMSREEDRLESILKMDGETEKDNDRMGLLKPVDG